MMPQKSSFQTALMIKALVSCKTFDLNLILRELALAKNLAIYVVGNWVLGFFNPF